MFQTVSLYEMQAGSDGLVYYLALGSYSLGGP
jgi:hypothetical protein